MTHSVSGEYIVSDNKHPECGGPEQCVAHVESAAPDPIGTASVEDAVAEATGAVTPKKELTHKEWKNLLRLYFTVRRPVVKECGHKIDTQSADGPNSNCQTCWFAFFNNNGQLVQTLDEMYQQHGPETIVRMRGVKFYKQWRKFMATVAQFKAQIEAAKADKTQEP